MRFIFKSLFLFIFFKVLKLDAIFLYKNQIFNNLIERSNLIKESNYIDLINSIKLMVPIGCSRQLIRIGGDKDGAYLIPDDLDNIDACFSPGTSHKKLFEDHLANKYKIKSFLSDGSVKESSLDLIRNYQVFQKKWINDFDDKNTTTLSSWIEDMNHKNSKNLLLQMDIEGSEYNSLLYSSEACLKQFRILVIEFHDLYRLKNQRFLKQIFIPIMQRILNQFDCVHAHANNCLPFMKIANFDIPQVIELTFYRKDCNKGIKKKYIPHPKDIVNVPKNPKMVLGKPWI
tara:strand:+ start:81 stop:941 length:861 start_codon:yes stop_codon:yes gene_type:complete